MRQVVLDTETTGLEPSQGHRVIEIGALELRDRRLTGRQFHEYLNPQRSVDQGALEVHGITDEFLADKPLFADVAGRFMEFIDGAELIIHNAPFDLGFLNHELGMLGSRRVEQVSSCLDTLEMARRMHPGMRNSLDALCKRYDVDNTTRTLHGALLDAEILADVYLAMTGGQVDLGLSLAGPAVAAEGDTPLLAERPALRVLRASAAETAAHQARLEAIRERSGKCLWLELEADGTA